MAGQKKQGKGGQRKYGRAARKACKVRYKTQNQRMKNKIRRIRRSNGEVYLNWWLHAVAGQTKRGARVRLA